jgi:inosine/xanthosine triphosphatase
MQRVAVGSSNPAKHEAVRRAFEEIRRGGFELQAVETEGGADQPWGEAATREGALARARAARAAEQADWGIGLEGGLVEDDNGILVTSWIAAVRGDGREGLARTAAFYLPEEIAALVRAGHELAAAWREAAGIEHIGRRGGTVGALTQSRIDRARLYQDAVVLAVALAEGR